MTILLFHDIGIETAERTFKALSKKYNLIHLNDLISAYDSNDFSAIPEKAMVITFDDGHVRNHEIFSVIKRDHIPVTIFLCAAVINTKRHFWWMTDTFRTLGRASLVDISNKERLDLMKNNGFDQTAEYENRQALTAEQINEMRQHVNFQGHTMFHPILPKCSEEEARGELSDSKKLLEQDYGFSINAISYPIGVYSARDVRLSKEAGYSCGVTVDHGFNSANSDRFRLKRISTNDTSDLNEMLVRASGLWSFIKTRNGKRQKIGETISLEEER